MTVNLAPHYTQRTYLWTTWKTVYAIKGGTHQYDDDGMSYTIWFYDGPEVHTCTIWKGAVPDGVLSLYNQTQNDTDKSDFETYYKPAGNKPIAPKTMDGRIRTTAEKPDTSRLTVVTHDWTDSTSWYQKSTRVVDEVVTCTVPFTIYTLDHSNVVDSYHGKIFGEDYLKDANGNSYRVVVKVDNVVKTERDPHVGSGGDYTINYATGAITFFSALTLLSEVKATYHYASDSTFTIKPSPGKQLSLEFVEVQFSDDIEITDTVLFQFYGYVQIFAPQLCPDPYPLNTVIPLGNPVTYKTIRDFQSDAVKSYPAYPALGGSSWRGMTRPVTIFDWDYLAATKVRSDYGMEIRAQLQHNVPFGGKYGTATFYCLSESL